MRLWVFTMRMPFNVDHHVSQHGFLNPSLLFSTSSGMGHRSCRTCSLSFSVVRLCFLPQFNKCLATRLSRLFLSQGLSPSVPEGRSQAF